MSRQDMVMARLLYIITLWLLIVLVSIRGYMADENDAKKALETSGYSNIQIIDRYNWMVWINGCGSSDAVAFLSKAKNPAGRDAEVLVCMGWPFKGSTVRMP